MAIAEPPTKAQAAHVNMMTDTIIANLPPAALRSVVRAVLASYPNFTAAFESRIRCMLGCGLCYQSLPLFGKIVNECKTIDANSDAIYDDMNLIASIDGDIVQAVTAVQKTLAVSTGTRELSGDETTLLDTLYESLTTFRTYFVSSEFGFPFQRGLVAISSLLDRAVPSSTAKSTNGTKSIKDALHLAPLEVKDTFQLGKTKLPRIFCGLWQLSSPALGICTCHQDHDRGGFRSAYPYQDALFTATKYCVFHPMTVTRETVQVNVTERCQRLRVNKVDLLQFHWQFFSLVDSRPTVRMGETCTTHNVKLLTYGTLWLKQPEPDLYGTEITPSQRKYYTMIRSWGGWELFQSLLYTLKLIGTKHNVSISNIATRWVLDFSYVGAVIVGSRMGISEHVEENLATFGWSLDSQDQEAIEDVLKKGRKTEMFQSMGDCGGEYR
uniref:Methylecgonone reductase n=1 Tax=Talaromyces marneffei PM1 TaxID=1077442 RepID=A0A093VMT6_TALMA